jgi:hypothetical protein
MKSKLMLSVALSGLMLMAAAAQQSQPPVSPPADNPAAVAPNKDATGLDSDAAKRPANAAQDQSKPVDAEKSVGVRKPAMAAEGPKFLTAQGSEQMAFSKFDGTDVVGPDNKKIGDVNDILFDKEHRIIAYVIGVGGFLGIGEKNVAIEPAAFELWRDPKDNNSNPNEIKLKVTWTKEQLENAPSFKYYDGRTATTGAGSPRDR